MQQYHKKAALLGCLAISLAAPAPGQSVYPSRLDDPQAIYLTPDKFPVHGDGGSDDTAALQAAIDKVRSKHGE